MKKSIALAAVLACVAMPAFAQTQVPLDRETFRQLALRSDAFEIASSRLALERSRSPRVRAFAQEMISDHAMTSQALNAGRAVYGSAGQVLPGTSGLAQIDF